MHVVGWGDKQPVPRKQLYPKAPPQAIDLLDQMLKINPQKRIGVQIALNQPFLSKYHDPNDEPICVPAFDFDFEEKVCLFEFYNRIQWNFSYLGKRFVWIIEMLGYLKVHQNMYFKL